MNIFDEVRTIKFQLLMKAVPGMADFIERLMEFEGQDIEMYIDLGRSGNLKKFFKICSVIGILG